MMYVQCVGLRRLMDMTVVVALEVATMLGFSWKRTFIALVTLALLGCGGGAQKKAEFALAVHGGAGTIRKESMTPEREKEYHAALREALEAGYKILDGGGSALDAVTASVIVLEDSPLFNAGKGAVFTGNGKNEMDASIMNGADLGAGAVASVTTIKNPILAARAVMEHTKHVMLVGRGAELFAAGRGLEIVAPEYFFTQRRWESLLKAKEKEKEAGNQQSLDRQPGDETVYFGTAAAVALDRNGNLAAGTSTGGLTNKMHGRVGDSPIVGAGTYANNATCAVSGTGTGEYFMRKLLTYRVSVLMEYGGMSLKQAANTVVHETLTGFAGEGTGGIIAVDKYGNIAMPFNTSGMYRGYVLPDGEYKTFLYKEE